MAAMAICSNLLVGLGARFGEGNSILLLILPLIVSIAFLLIAVIFRCLPGLRG